MNTRSITFLLATFVAFPAFAGEIHFDFEGSPEGASPQNHDPLDGWRVVEGQLGDLRGKLEHFRNSPDVPFNKEGKYYLTTLDKNGRSTDSMRGVMESPVWRNEGEVVSLLVGGGSHANTYVALCDAESGEEIYQARGENIEKFERVEWNTSDYMGKRLFLRLFDTHQGGWGHLAIDDVRAEGEIDVEATEDHFKHRSLVANLPMPPRPDPQAFEQPEVIAQPILFVTRKQYKPDHHNTATLFQTGEINTSSFTGGSALKKIDFSKAGPDGEPGEVTTLLECPQGVIRDPDVHFDGDRILFSMRKEIEDDYHLFEIDADGTNLRQLTAGSGLSDIDPIYLPDDRILFASTREPKYCMCNRHIMCNLYTMDADGANIQQIGHSTLFEGHPSLLPDGRVLYDRWEYVDRNFGDAQGCWVTNPDGTQHLIYYGNNTNSPGAVLDNRAVPNTSWIISTFSSCHDRPWGALALIDRSKGIDLQEPVLRTWPTEARELIGVGNYDTFKRVQPKYEDPFPLSKERFLCSRQVGQGEKMGIYLLDLQGHETLLYQEPDGVPLGCYDPMPLRARSRPPVLMPRTDLSQGTGAFYVSDVYIGTGMEKIPRGTVKWLRVVESPEKRFWTQQRWNGSGTQAPGMAWDDFNNKRILGTVPVEQDGSAHFEVPADTFLYFQLLDAKGRMVQSMRSGTIVRPGEQQGCIGCHEDRLDAVAPRRTVQALLRGPSPLEPWYGAPRLFNYVEEVQPVFDEHCLECHDYGKPGAEKVCLAGDRNLIFNCSYFELRKNKKYVNVPGAGPHPVFPPRSWGSSVSRLAEVVLEGHGDPQPDAELDLSKEDQDRVITWIDINAPYYPRYASAYPEHLFGRCPLDSSRLDALSELLGVNLKNQTNANQISFTRPAKSPALSRLETGSDAYGKAVAMIEKGKQMLQHRPRADMPEFHLTSPKEIAAEEKYQMMLQAEIERRKAIIQGEKQYDVGIDTEE